MQTIAQAQHARPRGFISWRPQAQTLSTLDNVRVVLDEYKAFLPLTIRQIFYRLVGKFGYDKTEQAYGRLCEHLNRARRARVIDFEAIRDDGFHRTDWLGWPSLEAAQQSLRQEARGFRLDRQSGQACRLVVWCEAQGMAPQLERVCEPYSVPAYSSGGFDSLTVKHSIAREFAELKRVRVLHIGDHDRGSQARKKAKTAPTEKAPAQHQFDDALLAELVARPSYSGGTTVSAYAITGTQPVSLAAMTKELRRQITQVAEGDLGRLEAMLVAQSHSLDAIFNKLALQARGVNDMHRYDQYLRLAFKAQGQCRATIETLGLLKNPHSTAFIKQQNLAVNQQVNNAPHLARAGKSESGQNKLLEGAQSEGMDAGTPPAAVTTHPPLAALEPIDGAEERSGKDSGQSECP
jgi:hypothetical protein